MTTERRSINPFRVLLTHANFRRFWVGQTLSLIGTWMQSMALGWLALELSNNAFIVGLVAASGSLPILLFSLHAGVMVDRSDKLRLVKIAQTLLLLEAGLLWYFTWTGRINIPGLLLLALFSGAIGSVEIPARQSLMIDLVGRDDHPVVHVAYEDADAYTTWSGLALPTEAEWERAARGGLDGATFVWGDEPESRGERRANYWHGDFPWRVDPGYGSTTPVGSYAANAYGLFDVAGNVWEWTSDWYSSQHPEDATKPCCVPTNPRGANEDASLDPAQLQFKIPRKVIKGGSFLCADSYCMRYRPAARRPQMVDTGMSHIGFRCVRR